MSTDEDDYHTAAHDNIVDDAVDNGEARHAFNQQQLFANVLASRIHLHKVVHAMLADDRPMPELAQALRGVVTALLRVRAESLKQGPFFKLGEHATTKVAATWEAVHGTDEALWDVHRQVIGDWERRETLASKRPLKALSRGVMDQVDAVLARRAELNATPSFAGEDAAFYDGLLKDFIASMDAERAGGGAKRRRKVKKANVDTKSSKGRQIRFDVHEKLVNFVPPVPLAEYKVDVNTLTKRLFAFSAAS